MLRFKSRYKDEKLERQIRTRISLNPETRPFAIASYNFDIWFCDEEHPFVEAYIKPKGNNFEILIFNPKKKNLAELAGILLHEILHFALKHFERSYKRIPQIWNVATDHVINLAITRLKNEKSKISLPENTIIIEELKQKNWPAEKVYLWLLRNIPPT